MNDTMSLTDCCVCVSVAQRVFEENRNAEMVEMQRLEEQERRRREEKVSLSVPLTHSGNSLLQSTVEPPSKGHYGANYFVPCT